jgi:hypothetical protein
MMENIWNQTFYLIKPLWSLVSRIHPKCISVLPLHIGPHLHLQRRRRQIVHTNMYLMCWYSDYLFLFCYYIKQNTYISLKKNVYMIRVNKDFDKIKTFEGHSSSLWWVRFYKNRFLNSVNSFIRLCNQSSLCMLS